MMATGPATGLFPVVQCDRDRPGGDPEDLMQPAMRMGRYFPVMQPAARLDRFDVQ